jgi:hypothetical protein
VQIRVAKPNAQSRASFENAGGEAAEGTRDEVESDMEETENRRTKKNYRKIIEID